MRRLQFTKFTNDDVEPYRQLVSNPQVMTYITGRPLTEKETVQRFAAMLERNQQHPLLGTYKALWESTNEFIGSGNITGKMDGSAELGYMLLPAYWGQGYGGTIAAHMLALAQEVSIPKVNAIIDPNNGASKRILTALGFQTVFVGLMDGLPGERLEWQLSDKPR